MDDMEIFRKLAQCEDKEQMQRCIDEYNLSQKSITNADRIRAMSDEELAYWIMCPYDSPFCDGIEHNCIECTKEWLKQPVEVSDHA